MPIDKLMPEILAGELLYGVSEELTGGSLCTTQYEGEIRNKGDKVIIPKVTNLTINDYSGSISYEDVDDDAVELTITEAKYFAGKIKDTDQAKTSFDLANIYLADGKSGLAQNADKHIYKTMALGADASNTISTITLSAANIVDTIVEAQEKLGLNGAIANRDKFIVISPKELSLLLKSDEFIRASDLGDQTLITGQVGQLHGFRVIVSNNVYTQDPDDLTTSDDVHRMLPFGLVNATAFANAIPPENVETMRLQDSFATGIRGLHYYGAKVILPKAIGVIKADTGVNGNN